MPVFVVKIEAVAGKNESSDSHTPSRYSLSGWPSVIQHINPFSLR